MKVGYLQTAPEFGNKERNFREVSRLVQGHRADLVVLPELFATGYAFTSKREAESLAESTHGETAAFLAEIAARIGGAVVGGFIEREGRRLYNASALATARGVVDRYRKIHLFYKEKIWFDRGDSRPRVTQVGGVKIGMMICFDWIFPEAARSLGLLGADVIAHPANLVLPYCQDAMVTRCLENRLFAVTANRIGCERRGGDSFEFTGRSQITAANGEILSRASGNRTVAGFVDVDVFEARNKRINPYNDLFVDRSPDRYIQRAASAPGAEDAGSERW
jgi:predicted amidohydrolase